VAVLKTDYGSIYYGGPCRDDYVNLVVYDQPPEGGTPIILQLPAMRSFREAENRLAVLVPRSSRIQRRSGGTRFIPIILTGSHRSCDQQTRLYASDSKRFASPSKTFHPRGLAVDISTLLKAIRVRDRATGDWTNLFELSRRVLRNHGWEQSRPTDEPWHASFGVRG